MNCCFVGRKARIAPNIKNTIPDAPTVGIEEGNTNADNTEAIYMIANNTKSLS
jgi:hypothetical protein